MKSSVWMLSAVLLSLPAAGASLPHPLACQVSPSENDLLGDLIRDSGQITTPFIPGHLSIRVGLVDGDHYSDVLENDLTAKFDASGRVKGLVFGSKCFRAELSRDRLNAGVGLMDVIDVPKLGCRLKTLSVQSSDFDENQSIKLKVDYVKFAGLMGFRLKIKTCSAALELRKTGRSWTYFSQVGKSEVPAEFLNIESHRETRGGGADLIQVFSSQTDQACIAGVSSRERCGAGNSNPSMVIGGGENAARSEFKDQDCQIMSFDDYRKAHQDDHLCDPDPKRRTPDQRPDEQIACERATFKS